MPPRPRYSGTGRVGPWTLSVAIVFAPAIRSWAETPPASAFPRFLVPGQEEALGRMEELFRLHHPGAFTTGSTWDAWLPHATLWAAVGSEPSARVARERFQASFLSRPIDWDGYVSVCQHRGLGHGSGWPFPTYQQSGGVGWHFSTADDTWAVATCGIKALTSAEGWDFAGATVGPISAAKGLELRATGPEIIVTTPPFRCAAQVAPFVRVEWEARGLADHSRPRVFWRSEAEPDWSSERSAPFPPFLPDGLMRYSNVPLYRERSHGGTLTRLRLSFDHAAGATLHLKSLITAIDTRHPITNFDFVRGSAEYFLWTGDIAFLRENIGRMRAALRFGLTEFDVEEQKHVRVPWVGHDGRSGLDPTKAGPAALRFGYGVGNNYWDLLPFGGHDALATIYLLDALARMAVVEGAIAKSAEWKIPPAAAGADEESLARLRVAVQEHAARFFWNDQTGRYIGWQDLDGQRHDYGFTFVNLEATAYGLATPEQGRSIFDWLDGRRIIAGDTSQGGDIYHWRFGPRSTTKRNVETYVWAWSDPKAIAWGDQVQDGGAVLGFSYFDLMARLRILGPDDAWRRLQAVTDWFAEVQAGGGIEPITPSRVAAPCRGAVRPEGSASTPSSLSRSSCRRSCSTASWDARRFRAAFPSIHAYPRNGPRSRSPMSMPRGTSWT